jgi:predicted membrane-bound dolichyl-phosphate-mannose-protein mannosyltransferase/Gpi18-like mannosyltransferase
MAVAVVLFVATATLAEGANLIPNGGFESMDASGGPEGWYSAAYRTQEGYTRFSVSDTVAHSGLRSAKIDNANTNDARYVCTVPVEPDSLYRVTGYILVEAMEDYGNGANIGIEGVYAFSQTVFDTQGAWREIQWYGETGEDQHEIELGVRVGGYSAESQGTAYFDDIRVEKVSTVPTGVIPSLWYTVDVPVAEAETAAAGAAALPATAWFLLIGAAFVLLVALVSRPLLRADALTPARQGPLVAVFFFVMLAGLALRVVVGGSVAGYPVDMGCFSAWSLRMASVGPLGFYSPDYFCDYPPGYMLLLWPVGLLVRALGYADSPLIRLIIKAIPILCDMGGALVLFAYAKKRVPMAAAMLLALLVLLNPASIIGGAAWGQVDSLLGLLLLLAAITAMETNWKAALPLYVAALLVKPQALLFAPVAGIWLLLSLFSAGKDSRRKQLRSLLWGLGISLAVAVAVVVPFSIRQTDPLWLVSLYQKTVSSYDYAVLNTANLLYVLGGNWSPLTNTDGRSVLSLSPLVPALTGVLLLLAGVWAARLWHEPKTWLHGLRTLPARLFGRDANGGGRRDALALLCLAAGFVFLGLAFTAPTFLLYGTAMMVLACLFAITGLVADRSADTLPFYLALLMLLLYVFGLKIHERYLYAALLLLLLGYARTRDRRLLWLCAGLSATTFVNVAIVLNNALVYGASMGHLNADTLGLNSALSVLNVLLALYGGAIAVTGLAETTVPQRQPQNATGRNEAYRTALLSPADARLRLTVRDYAIMAATAILYAVLAFANLGSTVAPQTAWVSTSAAEQVVFELDHAQHFKLLYYAGVSYADFSVSVSDDGVTWSKDYPCEMREGLCYRWNYAVTAQDLGAGAVDYDDNNPDNILWLTGKYLRVNAEGAGLNLWEIVLRGTDGVRIPVTLTGHTGAKNVLDTPKPPDNLIDEQTTLTGEPGWFNGTYFDEIYHARTAYEHLHGLSPYETTHPPLGKLLMAAGVALFGMTPFGWRFAGALTGVLMLPALYLLVKQLTRKRGLATFAMLLFAFDLMHFTQTRIATIDSFPVLFIILSTLCMSRYLMADAFAVPVGAHESGKPRALTKPFLKTLIPLALGGLFMGLSIASKWIGLYSAVGLAAMFAVAVYRQLRTGFVAFDIDLTEEMTASQRLRVLWARRLTLRRVLLTCAACVVFFIAIPALIYYLSYIPYLSPSGPVTVERIIKAQEGMLAYHSTPGLGMDHPFNSPWWQWPFILKPMWFCQDKFEPTGFASTIMCMGNPLIFYVGAVCMAAVFALFIGKHLRFKGGLRLRQGDGNLTLALLVLGFLTQYLPWVLVPRSMYIYHYFASVPFIILATTVVFDLIPWPKAKKRAMIVYVALAAGFFALFYPYASGLLTPTSWLDWLKWFPKIYY